jgi:2-haloacid dehalogenase
MPMLPGPTGATIAPGRARLASRAMTSLDFDDFDVLTFDCYGTLIDWESGILTALRPPLAAHGIGGSDVPDDALLEAFARHESEAEAGPYRPYREVLGAVLTAMLAHRGAEPTADERAAFGASVADWPAFPDSAAALDRLQERFKLGVITNCDDDLFAASEARLGTTFDWVVTAEQARRYKPNPRGFELMFERVGIPPSRILHVAQSLFHDHVTAKRLGLSTVWVDRRSDRPGSGATPPAEATPDLTVPDMATLAALAVPA